MQKVKKLRNINLTFSDKRLLYFLIFAVTSFMVIMYFIPATPAFAFVSDNITDKWEEAINSGVGEAVENVFSQDGAIYKALITENKVVAPVYNTLAAVSAAIAVLFIYIDIVQEILHGQDKVECFIKGFIKGLTVCIIILLLTRILTAVEGLGQALYTDLTTAMSDAATADGATGSGFKASDFSDKTGPFGFIARVVGTFFPYLLAQLSIIVAQVVAYSIIVELTIRKMFSPLAVANISVEGFRGPGMRWFKRYLALYIRMIVIYALSYVNSALLSAIVKNLTGLEAAFGVVVVNFTVVSMMIKSSEIANEIMGT